MKLWVMYGMTLLCSAQGLEFVRIPGQPFVIGRTEVTVEQFSAFVKQAGYRTAAEVDGSARTWRSPGYRISKRQPVVYVTFEDAQKFCEFAGGRLPADEEWLLAARAGSKTRHYWGPEIDGQYLWYRPNSDGHPHDVAKKKPNAYGLYDIEGNVWEWTAMPPVNGEAMGCRRGGSWASCENSDPAPSEPPRPMISMDYRVPVPVRRRHRHDDIGFRCVRTIEAATLDLK